MFLPFLVARTHLHSLAHGTFLKSLQSCFHYHLLSTSNFGGMLTLLAGHILPVMFSLVQIIFKNVICLSHELLPEEGLSGLSGQRWDGAAWRSHLAADILLAEQLLPFRTQGSCGAVPMLRLSPPTVPSHHPTPLWAPAWALGAGG